MLSILSLIQMITGKYRTVIVKYTHKTWNMDVFYHIFKIFLVLNPFSWIPFRNKFLHILDPDPYKNDMDPQHCQ